MACGVIAKLIAARPLFVCCVRSECCCSATRSLLDHLSANQSVLNLSKLVLSASAARRRTKGPHQTAYSTTIMLRGKAQCRRPLLPYDHYRTSTAFKPSVLTSENC